jgi:hypothetical protein
MPSITDCVARISRFHSAVSGAAVAFIAAALGDSLVESISNTGVFGRAFSDSSQQGVAPVIVAGTVLALLLVVAHLRSALGGRLRPSHPWARDVANAFAQAPGMRNIAFVFVAQIAIVYVMENAESLVGTGQAIHGLSWLGAPIAVSLCVHFAVCVLCVFAARHASRFVLAGMIAAIRRALDILFVMRLRDALRGVAAYSGDASFASIELLLTRRLRGRAPPSLAASFS